jgi:putative resolvase
LTAGWLLQDNSCTFPDFYIYFVSYLSMKVRISKAARETGVAIESLRRWEAASKIEVERTPLGHRRYDLARAVTSTRATLGYARVSSHDQKSGLLITQVALLESYGAANGWTDEALQDSGSGLNHYQRGLR